VDHEQIAWIDGARRFVVSRTCLAVPATRDQIVQLAVRVRAESRDFMNLTSERLDLRTAPPAL